MNDHIVGGKWPLQETIPTGQSGNRRVEHHNLRLRARGRREMLVAWLLTAPALILLVALFFLPVVGVFTIAVTDWQFGASALSFVGLANFREVLADDGFHASLMNTVVYVLTVLPGTVGLGLAIALVIESSKSFRSFYRAIHFLPYMATLAAMAIAWEALLHPTIGLVNQTLVGLGWPTANWLRDERTVLPVLAIIGIWQNLGFAMVLFLAGLKSIPQDLYDAADLDGADIWFDRLRIVTMPLLGPVFMFVFIVVALNAFESFDAVQILTQGGPGHASEMLLFTIYRESFEFFRTGYGASVAVVFLLVVVLLTMIQASAMDRRVHYQ
ncbi:carbohydrate ABC transporter permease [Rhizobium azibense]|uniref:Carbohydrate ABC transporter membrane protein 1 (CUT1 family) n=1 Tax=Rhizobium azibense TaxID=1136135 RepID=A0A4R3RMS9_9HYPH|nr:sugar ABC transporter permease [Rhizobium azibense]TCU32826.1 carbohydrate ABC transporter membrane protein 1 (CUT1 family) [Rhizobium azibense]